jgi:hypothetical protein
MTELRAVDSPAQLGERVPAKKRAVPNRPTTVGDGERSLRDDRPPLVAGHAGVVADHDLTVNRRDRPHGAIARAGRTRALAAAIEALSSRGPLP